MRVTTRKSPRRHHPGVPSLGVSTAVDETAVIDWRRQQLEAAGCDPRLALAIALEPAADYHRVVELVGRGCDCRTAWRILRPDA